MKLVIDSNIIFSALLSPGGKTAELIFVKEIELWSTRTLEEELLKYKSELLKKSNLSEIDFELLKELLFDKINFVEDEELFDYAKTAKEICPDKGDIQFFAVCLAKNIPLWSNDKKLKQQNFVKVISTEELVKKL